MARGVRNGPGVRGDAAGAALLALFWKAIDKYLIPGTTGVINVVQAKHGLLLISGIYILVLLFDFLAQYIQIRIMQRVGQQTMYDMRKEIFGHLQRLPMLISTGTRWDG